jgi:regulator of protease activity HflC (stomatin/prohibitin superfamily)
MGLEKIIDFILQFLNDFLPFFITKEWQQTVVLRFGVIHRVKSKGIHFKIPFADEPVTYSVITTTMATSNQTIVTSDDKEVTIKAVIKYNIEDVLIHTKGIYDATDALIDITEGHIMNQVNIHTYEECRDTLTLSNEVAKKVRNEVKRYGVAIETITLTNFVKTGNYRLFKDEAI